MAQFVGITAGSDEPVVLPVSDVHSGWSVSAVVREWPGGPALHEWSSQAATAVVEDGTVALLCDDSRSFVWTSGQFSLVLTDPSGDTFIRGPFRARVRQP